MLALSAAVLGVLRSAYKGDNCELKEAVCTGPVHTASGVPRIPVQVVFETRDFVVKDVSLSAEPFSRRLHLPAIFSSVEFLDADGCAAPCTLFFDWLGVHGEEANTTTALPTGVLKPQDLGSPRFDAVKQVDRKDAFFLPGPCIKGWYIDNAHFTRLTHKPAASVRVTAYNYVMTVDPEGRCPMLGGSIWNGCLGREPWGAKSA